MLRVLDRRRAAYSGLLVLGLLPLALAACDDQPAECERAPLGEFSFILDPADSTQFTGALTATTRYASVPPTWEYVFRTNGGRRVALLIPEVGPSLPVTVGGNYSVLLQRGGIDPHHAFGIRVTDGTGLRFLAVSDWTPGYSIFITGSTNPGYALNTERLIVLESDPGCDPIQEHTDDYLLLRNRRLKFVIEGVDSADLYHGQSATVGDWVVHTHEAMEVKTKNPALIQNQMSFSVERAGLR